MLQATARTPHDPSPSAQKHTAAVALDRERISLLSGTDSAHATALRRALAPMRLFVHPTEKGVGLVGNDVALMLATRALEAFRSSDAAPDAQAFEAMVQRVIDDALQRDLAFRLRGLFFPVRALSIAQYAYMERLLNDAEDMVIGVGPTGTGKTHIAIAAGLSKLAEGAVKHLVVTRPRPVGARDGSRGGDEFTVIEDILHDLISHDEITRLLADRRLMLAPLEFLRGRTFNDSFVVFDEAQNTSPIQMRMVVTRVGRDSRIAVVGDPAQRDRTSDRSCGLADLLSRIDGAKLAAVHRFAPREIIRNPLVRQLEALYAEDGGPAKSLPGYAA